MNRLILALALLLASTLVASPAGQKVSPVEVKSCGAGTFFDQLAGTGLWHCGTPPATPPSGGNYAIQYSSGGAFAGAIITGLVLGRGALNSPTAYGGTSGVAHQWITALDASGIGTFTRPACADLSDAGAGCSGGAGGSPGGTTGNVQYNNAGALGGLSGTGLVLDQGSSTPVIYGGGVCTNQFIRSLNASGSPTCASVANIDLANSTISGIALGSNLNSLTHGSTLTGTSYNGSATISNWDIDLTHANTWSGAQTFGEVIGAVTTQSGASYTLAAADCGTLVRFTSGSAVTLTLPNSLPAGCSVAVLQAGTAQVTMTAGASATLVSRPGYTKTAGQWGLVGLSVDTNTGSAAHYVMTGDGV